MEREVKPFTSQTPKPPSPPNRPLIPLSEHQKFWGFQSAQKIPKTSQTIKNTLNDTDVALVSLNCVVAAVKSEFERLSGVGAAAVYLTQAATSEL
jgi:hypothetical protein